MVETSELLKQFLLFVLLPLWSVAGLADWVCHRLSKIEATSGVRESLLHSLMGIQVGITIIICLFFKINVLILLICFAVWLSHEFIAHLDVKWASPVREITIWEMHAHSYLATLPMYMLITITILSWEQFLQLLSLNWNGHMSFELLHQPHGGSQFIYTYLVLMLFFGVFPYAEELFRCVWYRWFRKTK